ncbi:unnamed protein product [Rotaria socialis]|uniref:Uncharacterized protein n=1 Tax=Rotaria socialis TaxID=392032 RepID=A0A817ZYL0_9BILA|nr:unnamed protein product [Rotaria socialis]
MSNEDNNCQARLPLKDVPIELQQKVIDLGGKPDLNLYKVLANNPTLLSSWIEIFRGAQLYLMNNDFSRDCIYHAINHQLDRDDKKYETRQLIEYCIRPSSNKEYEDVINGTIYSVLTFDQLKKQNITTESLVDWTILIDLLNVINIF